MAPIKSTCRGCKMGIADISFHVHFGGCEYDPRAKYNFKHVRKHGLKLVSPQTSPDLSPDLSPDSYPRIPCDMCVRGLHGGCQN